MVDVIRPTGWFEACDPPTMGVLVLVKDARGLDSRCLSPELSARFEREFDSEVGVECDLLICRKD